MASSHRTGYHRGPYSFAYGSFGIGLRSRIGPCRSHGNGVKLYSSSNQIDIPEGQPSGILLYKLYNRLFTDQKCSHLVYIPTLNCSYFVYTICSHFVYTPIQKCSQLAYTICSYFVYTMFQGTTPKNKKSDLTVQNFAVSILLAIFAD